jgi:hypothetical protein
MSLVRYPEPSGRAELRNLLYEEQDGVCAACGTDDPGTDHGWQLDHCHDTEYVRGVLCLGCNMALGCIRDSVDALRGLADYLERFEQVLQEHELREAHSDYLGAVADEEAGYGE